MWDAPHEGDASSCCSVESRSDGGQSYWSKDGREIYLALSTLPGGAQRITLAATLCRFDVSDKCWSALCVGVTHSIQQRLAHCMIHLQADRRVTVFQSTVLDLANPESLDQHVRLLKTDMARAQTLLANLPPQLASRGFPHCHLRPESAYRFTKGSARYVEACISAQRALAIFGAKAVPRPLSESPVFQTFLTTLLQSDEALEKQEGQNVCASEGPSRLRMDRFDTQDTVTFWRANGTEVAVTRLLSNRDAKTVIVYAKACRCFVDGMVSMDDLDTFSRSLNETFAPLEVSPVGADFIVYARMHLGEWSLRRIEEQIAGFWKGLHDTRRYFETLERTGLKGRFLFEIVNEVQRAMPQGAFETVQEERRSTTEDRIAAATPLKERTGDSSVDKIKNRHVKRRSDDVRPGLPEVRAARAATSNTLDQVASAFLNERPSPKQVDAPRHTQSRAVAHKLEPHVMSGSDPDQPSPTIAEVGRPFVLGLSGGPASLRRTRVLPRTKEGDIRRVKSSPIPLPLASLQRRDETPLPSVPR